MDSADFECWVVGGLTIVVVGVQLLLSFESSARSCLFSAITCCNVVRMLFSSAEVVSGGVCEGSVKVCAPEFLMWEALAAQLTCEVAARVVVLPWSLS